MKASAKTPGAVLLVQKIGPYHHARFSCAARDGRLTVVEYRPNDSIYAWDRVEDTGAYRRLTVERGAAIETTLAALGPEAVVCTGYSDPEIHRAARWALRHKIPMVVCSESTFDDEPRIAWREALKRRVVAGFHAGLAGGSRSADYLRRLGLPGERVFIGWDVVDNDYFWSGAQAARARADELREKLRLPARYFLCVSRFVPEKNLGLLLEAYAQYARDARGEKWRLVMAGGGELTEELQVQVVRLGVEALVSFPGFIQYPDLPAFYGLAGAFVLPSKSEPWGLVVNEAMAAGLPVLVSERCGCAPDLVEVGKSGFVFRPEDFEGLAALMNRMTGAPAGERAEMGENARKRVARFAPEDFSRGLWTAVQAARAVPARRAIPTRIALAWLARRWGAGMRG